MRQTTRRVVLTAVCVLPALLLGALSVAQDNTPKPQTAKQKFKNIKVLKDMPAERLGPYMHEISNSLSVGCDFCHVINPDHSGFEKDDKPMKDVARKMIVMTNDLNAHQKILDKKATCFMCHHGHPEPENKAPAERR
ncbi:MAG TPA: c-type cytochrome [Chthonomonadaceae bacterium]|nr:c-type cytochrome [Chthonomonadaceae bacterium]